MISALLYLQFHSIKNRLSVRLRRLKKPKYLAGAIVGGLYFYFYFFRWMFAGIRGAKGVAAAAFCPFLNSGRDWALHGSIKVREKTVRRHSCHDSGSPESQPAVRREIRFHPSAISASEDPTCNHCISHSQTNPARSAVATANSTSIATDSELPLNNSSCPEVEHRLIETLVHGPPGPAHSRIVFLNSFRI